MQPTTETQTDPQRVVDRATRLRGRLQSSEYTRKPGEMNLSAGEGAADK
jgi:hypothetical protein